MGQGGYSGAAIRQPPVSPANEAAALYRLTDRLYRARSLDDIYEAALDAIIETLGCARASILLFDDAGVMRFVASRGLSENYRKMLEGHSPWKPGERDPQPIFVSDIDVAAEPDWVKATIKKEGIRGLAFIPLAVQGTVIGKFMTYYEAPHAFADHEVDLAVTIARQVGFSLERARADQARIRSEWALRASEERFRLAVEAAPSGMLMANADGQILMVNAHAENLFGYSRDEMVGQKLEFLVPERFRRSHPGYRKIYSDRPSVRPMGAGRDLFALRKDGTEVPVEIGLSPIGTFEGVMTLAAVVDISARKQAEAHRELLVAELNHRVKNTLALVQGIAHQTFKSTASSSEQRKAFEGRLIALGRAHDLLTQANWENASLDDLAADALQARGANKKRVSLSGPSILLPPRQALAIGMALHELLTNAIKYGALSNDVGRVELNWNQSDEVSRVKIVWREHGGPPVSAPKHHGFGSILLERNLGRELDGQVSTEFRPEGLLCMITVHVSKRDEPIPEVRSKAEPK